MFCIHVIHRPQTQAQIAKLFETTPQNITMHLRSIYNEYELEEIATCKNFLQVRKEGNRTIKRNQRHYNLDAIISIGYRVKSIQATQFRIWATQRLKEYLVQGYAINENGLHRCIQLFLATYYAIEHDMLTIHGGWLYKRKKIPVASIRKIEKTRTFTSAPAPSLDRLEIFFNRFDSVVISPEDKAGFIAELTRLNPEIEVV